MKTTTRKPRLGFATAVASALVALALLAGCGGGGDDGAPRHVFLITVDTLRADHLQQYGYPRETSPSLDRLTEPGVVFDRAVAQWPKTGPSMASAFIGQYPQTTGLTHKAALRLPDAYLTLPELMKEQGFTTLAVVSNGVMAAELGWDQGFDAYEETWKLAPEPSDDPVEYRKYLNARRVNELAVPLIEKHRDAERLFVWLHYSDPHTPYLLPEDVENPFLGDEHHTQHETARVDENRAVALGDHTELGYYIASYDGNIRFTDQHIGRVLDLAEDLDLLDDALVVFTADHGESLGEHDYYFGHGRLPYQPGAHVPLVFTWGGRIGGDRRIGEPVELVDLYPTVRDLIDPALEIPGLEGDTLLPLLLPDEAERPEDAFRFAFAEAGGGSPTTHYRWVRDERWKLIYHPPLGERPRTWELYDLEQDPGESVNRVEQEPRHFRRLRSTLSDWMKGSEWIRRPQSEVEVHTEETEKALRALGYIN